ncbi:MAG: DJ-1/PfpI family protein [Candidatus Firestonebacteria bacterium]|nr:DJ-1/PfpI family protein [Candidatus Firestonebacteria bacterium]
MSKILVLVYDGFSEIELSFPVSMFSIFGGVDYDVVALKNKEVTGWAGITIVASKLLKEISPLEYDALLLPGISPFMVDDLLKNEPLLKLVKNMYINNKIVAAICLTPLILAKAGILKGKSLSSDAPPESYSEYEIGDILQSPIVLDGNIITGKGPGFIKLTQSLFESLGHAELGQKLLSFLYDSGRIIVEDMKPISENTVKTSCNASTTPSCCG